MSLSHRTLRVAIAALVTVAGSSFAATAGQAQDTGQQYQFLFVQNATSGGFDGTGLSLKNVGPTIAFSDRPQRITGHMRTDHFVRQWGLGEDSFRDNPPNAGLSIYTKDPLETAVVVISNPQLNETTPTSATTSLSTM